MKKKYEEVETYHIDIKEFFELIKLYGLLSIPAFIISFLLIGFKQIAIYGLINNPSAPSAIEVGLMSLLLMSTTMLIIWWGSDFMLPIKKKIEKKECH